MLSRLLAILVAGLAVGCAGPDTSDPAPKGDMPERRINEIQKEKGSDAVSGVEKSETDN